MGLVGLALLANAAWMVVQRLSATGLTTGQVVGHEAKAMASIESSSEATTLYHPVIEFTDRQRRRHRFTAVGGHPQPRPPRGTRLRVRFGTAQPETAYVATFSQMWVMPMAWALAGAVVLYVWR